MSSSETHSSHEKQPKNVLIITKEAKEGPLGGRELLCLLNIEILRSIYSDRLTVLKLPIEKLTGAIEYANAFRGHIDGLSDDSIDRILKTIDKETITKVFVDGSNLGEIVRILRRHAPNVETTVFFHNCETRFFWGAFRANKSLRAFAVVMANFLAERKSVRYSNKRICLSDRDSRQIERIHGRGATHISAIALEDKLPSTAALALPELPETFGLFVGGAFYANRSGIEWYICEVTPITQVPVYIVGRGFEDLKSTLEVAGKVRVIGETDSVAPWYAAATFVIAPIFDGSGMKTKVAEALMFGKKVVGSPEAFSGYEDIVQRAGWICHDAQQFAAAVEQAERETGTSFDNELRTLFLQNYSQAAARQRFHAILEN
jgi:glycosyltransferase involved in cell wall biosynthesis